jgi:cyclohexadienyl dehydratase
MIRMFRAGLAAALVLFAAPASAQEVSRLDRILQSGALRVGTAGDYKPFTYRDPATGALSGLDIDQAEALGRALGVTVEFVQTAWPTLMKDFETDRFDIAMGGVSVTLDRAKKGYFSTPYLRDGKTPIT